MSRFQKLAKSDDLTLLFSIGLLGNVQSFKTHVPGHCYVH